MHDPIRRCSHANNSNVPVHDFKKFFDAEMSSLAEVLMQKITENVHHVYRRAITCFPSKTSDVS